MSFTEDELQAFSSILEQRFAAHRQETERALNERLTAFQQEIDRRFLSLKDEMTSTLKQELTTMNGAPETGLMDRLREQQNQMQNQIVYTVNQEADQKLRQVEATVDRMLAAQLLGIEQLLHRQQTSGSFMQQLPQQLEAIEVQTELSWEDLTAAVGKALDERLVALSNSLQHSVKELEEYLTARLDDIARNQNHGQPYGGPLGNGTSAQEMLAGIEHLDRVMESMQVAMTANHALLSNRLYHHQQLPVERAHPVSRSQVTPVGENASLLAQSGQAGERTSGGGPDDQTVSQHNEGEETAGQ